MSDACDDWDDVFRILQSHTGIKPFYPSTEVPTVPRGAVTNETRGFAGYAETVKLQLNSFCLNIIE